MIALRILKFGQIGQDCISYVVLYVHLSLEDCAHIVDDCMSVIEDWPRIGQDCIKLSFSMYISRFEDWV